MTSRAEHYRQVAREFHFTARSLPPGEVQSALLKLAEEWDWLADQQDRVDKATRADSRDAKPVSGSAQRANGKELR